MAETLQLRLDARLDGEPVRGYPVSYTLSVNELLPFDLTLAPTGAGFDDTPGEVLTLTRVLLLRTTGPITIQFEGEMEVETIPLDTDGALILWNAELTGDPLVRITLRNASTLPVRVSGFVAGT